MRPKVSLKAILYTKLANSTFDGVAKIVRSSRLLIKLLWSIALAIFVTMCSYLVIKSFLDYYSYDIVTSISVRTEIPAKMPTVILCNTNGLTTPTSIYWASYVYSLYGITKSNYYLNFQASDFKHQINNKGNILTPRTMVMTAARNSKLTDSFRQSLGLSMKDMLISCTLNSVECTADNFVWLFDTYYGNCFQFNASGLDQISQAGKLYGLKMELFVGKAVSSDQLAQNSGVHLIIVNETVKINTFSDSINAGSGKETSVLVYKKRIKKIQKPYGECTSGLTSIDAYPTYLYKLTYTIYNTYRQKDCFNSCFQENSILKLGCYVASFPYLSNTSTPACLSGLDLYNSLLYFKLFFIQDVSTKCSDCPLECESEIYSFSSSTLDYPTVIYAKMLSNQSAILKRFNNVPPTYKQLKQSIMALNINYNELGYTHIEESQKRTVIDLVTNIGGSISLLLGLSFLSSFEIVELMLDLLLGFIQIQNKTHLKAF